MAMIATIPLSKIERIQIYLNTVKKANGEYKSLDDVMKETGADYGINGTLYNGARQPVMHFRADGKTYSSDQYNYNGFGWDSGADIRCVESKNKESVRNYICGVEMVHAKKSATMYYNADLGGARGRTAIALKGESLVLYCVGDGESGRCTPEELRAEMLTLGMDYAVMLDGGGSAQCSFPDGKKIVSARAVQNYILIFLKKEGNTVGKTPLVYLDPGHGGKDTSNQSPDGRYKEHQFSLDMGQRIRTLLQNQGVMVKLTRELESQDISLVARAAMANQANADLFVSLHSNASGNTWSNARGLVVYTCAEGGTRDVMAKNILARMKEAGVKTFGYELYHAKFTVIWKTSMPACLIEFLFHTNQEDVKLLLDSAYRDKMALAAAKGICDTLGIAYKEKTKTKYTVTVATLESKADAQKVVDKLKEIGVSATIKEEEVK